MEGDSQQKHVLLLSVFTGGTTWLRSLCVTELPKKDDIVFYYQTLCGFRDAVVSVTVHTVPAEFQESLLAVDSATFPVCDVVAETEEKVVEYRAYVHQVCEAERSRCRLAMDRATSVAVVAAKEPAKKRKTWASELLSQLSTPADDSSSDVAVNAWILMAPLAKKKSRLIIDPSVGKAWESRLGSPLYPDLVVARRLSTASWNFQHPSSVSLLSATIAWYLENRGVVVAAGVSDWAEGAESDLIQLMAPFAAVKKGTADPPVESVHEEPGKPLNTTLKEDRPSLSRFIKIKATPPKPIVILLQKIEQTMLFSRMENGAVEPLSHATFSKFLRYMARGHGIQDYDGDEIVDATLKRWGTAQMGFCKKTKPLLSSWLPLWDTLLSAEGKKRDAVTATRIDLLLRTLDAWDACESAMMTEEAKQALVCDWIAVYRDRELVADRGSRTAFDAIETDLLAYLDQFVPRPFVLLHKRIRDVASSMFVKKGYSAALLSGTLYLVGARTSRVKAEPQSRAEKTAAPVKKETVVSNTVVNLGFL